MALHTNDRIHVGGAGRQEVDLQPINRESITQVPRQVAVVALGEHGVEGLGEIETYDVHVTNLPSGDYLNVVVTGSEAGYLIGKYQFDGTDAVSVWFPGNAALEQAVKSGKLPGTTKVEGGMTDVRITASPEQWQAFLAKPPEGFFDEPISFKRIGPAYVEQQ